jgi:hypothetical protein
LGAIAVVTRASAKRLSAVAVATATALFLAAPAWATQRYAHPAGAGTTCSQASPCDLVTAVNNASNGDEVIVAPGDYGSGTPLATEISVNNGVEVHGASGQPRPRVFSSAFNAISVNAGGTMRDIELVNSGYNGLFLYGGTAERIVVRATGTTACAGPMNGGTLRNSICVNTGLGTNHSALSLSCSGCTGPGSLRNVTAYSSDIGLRVGVGNSTTLVVSATNVIAHGGTKDVSAYTSGSIGPMSATVNLDHSNYATTEQLVGAGGGTATVTPAGSGTNQTASPKFVNTFSGDFHQAASSPTIDAGITSGANGSFDVDGEARAQGSSTDIGGDELPAPTPPPAGPADKTKPVASRLDVRPDVFAALRGRGPSVVGAKRRAPKGATVRYRLSEAATVTFRVERVLRGRKKGRRCVPRRRNGRRCARYKRLRGSFTHSGATGANRFRVSGRLRNKPLEPGRYRLVGTPRDAAGNVGGTVRTKFRIVRK